VLVVPEEVKAAAIRRALAEADILSGGDVEADDVARDVEPPTLTTVSDALRARFAAWRARPTPPPARRQPAAPTTSALDRAAAFAAWRKGKRVPPGNLDAAMHVLLANFADSEVRELLAMAGDYRTLEMLASRSPRGGAVDVDDDDDEEDDDVEDDDVVDWDVAVWHVENIPLHCHNAALEGRDLAIRWRGAEIPVAVHDVVKRGRTYMLLGDNLQHGGSMAVKIDEIEACGELVVAAPPTPASGPPSRRSGAPAPTAASPSRPPRAFSSPASAFGSPRAPAPPVVSVPRPTDPHSTPRVAGHLPCPCGSGARYRNCCRTSLPS
jgi:hypothetical protein